MGLLQCKWGNAATSQPDMLRRGALDQSSGAYEAGLEHILTPKIQVWATTGLPVVSTHVTRTSWDYWSANGAIQHNGSEIHG